MELKVASEASAKGLVHRYVTMIRQNERGKKPYAQKGTGNARRGSRVSPLMPGGGIVFGPKPRDWTVSMNKREKQVAMATAIQSAAEDSMVVVDGFAAWESMKTKELVQSLAKVGADPMAEAVYLIVADYNEALFKAANNVQYLQVATVDNLNVYDVLRATKLVVDTKAREMLHEKYA
ncbi:unnamed protein product [Pedinophyceae sp. YPF-701]|nr:unnamed protein product [Pedinophyceae sp. YPF-701]